MSLWTQVQNLNGIRELYGNHFPLEIRHFFSTWIESQKWFSIDENDEESASKLLETLVKLMQTKISELQQGHSQDDTFLLRLRLEEIVKDFEKRYQSDPLTLLRTIKDCLRREKEILDSKTAEMNGTMGVLDDQLMHNLNEILKEIENSETELRALQAQQESFVIQYQELRKLPENSKSKKTSLEKTLSEDGTKILKVRQLLTDFYHNALEKLAEYQSDFCAKLDKWRESQCLNTTTDEEELDNLQSLCEKLADCEWMIRQQLKQFSVLHEQLYLKPDEPDTTIPLNARLMSQCTFLLKSLIQSSFILEKHPPQVLKTQTKFSTTPRLLIGGKLNIYLNPPESKACIISQPQAKSLISCTDDLLRNVPQSQQILEGLCNITGTLTNDKKTFEFSKETNSLKCNYKNLSLKKIKRKDTKSDETVTEEKFALVVYCFLVIGDLSFYIYVMSNPLVVIVHGNQHSNAVATILWDNFFRQRNREPFQVPESVAWRDASYALNRHFTLTNSVPLKDSDLEFLRVKIFGHSVDNDLSWSQFNRETLPGRQFSFWEWFHGIEELVRKYAHNFWTDGLLVGFISKKDAEVCLINKVPGTFLLRFADSEIGGISVAYLSVEQGVKRVWHLQPWFSKDLLIRSLADRLGDLAQLTYIYASNPKDYVFEKQAISKYYTKNQPMLTSNDDYVRTSIAATVLLHNLNLNLSKRKEDFIENEWNNTAENTFKNDENEYSSENGEEEEEEEEREVRSQPKKRKG